MGKSSHVGMYDAPADPSVACQVHIPPAAPSLLHMLLSLVFTFRFIRVCTLPLSMPLL